MFSSYANAVTNVCATGISDGGVAGSRVPVAFTFGDQSGSHSEKYRLELTPVQTAGADGTLRSFIWTDAQYGVCETKTALVSRACCYELRMFHAGTREGDEPDYDYSLSVSHPQGAGVIASDPAELIRADDQTSDYFSGEGKVAHLYVLGRPRLVFDYDRDGDIDGDDVARTKNGTVFRFWINDDNDGGDVNDSVNDRPGSGSNCSDGQVNGRGDLLDFTPVWIDRSEVFPLDTPQSVMNQVTWRLRSTCVKAVWSYANRDNAGAFHRESDLYDFGLALADLPECAGVAGLSAGTNLVVEAVGPSSEVLVSAEANVCISPVDEMYRWINVRGLSGEAIELPTSLGSPSNRPDGERPCTASRGAFGNEGPHGALARQHGLLVDDPGLRFAGLEIPDVQLGGAERGILRTGRHLNPCAAARASRLDGISDEYVGVELAQALPRDPRR